MLDHLQATLDRIEALNAYVHDQKVRQFQYDILSTGAFQLHSPWTGRALECVEARLIAYINDPYHFKLPLYAYRFQDRADIWVMSVQIGLGFPLCALFIDGVYLAYTQARPPLPAAYAILKRLAPEFDALAETAPEETVLTEPLAILGHPNFAHHMWNELPALNHLRSDTPVSIQTLFAPLGPLDGLPEPRPFRALRCQRKPYFSPIGGELLDQQTARGVTTQLPAPATEPPRDDALLIWIAHREDGRSCENFLEMLQAFDQQVRQFCTPRYIFDSFSAPADLNQPWYDPVRTAFKARQAQSEVIFKAMTEAVGGPEAVHATTSGLTVTQALALAQHADFYITPVGSIQHKVAWLQSIPGLVHGPHGSMNWHVANWHGQKSEIAVPPCVLPSELVEDTGASAHHPNAARNMNYRITNPDAAARVAVNHLCEALGLTR